MHRNARQSDGNAFPGINVKTKKLIFFFYVLKQEKTTVLSVGNATSRANQDTAHLCAQKSVFPLIRPNGRHPRLLRKGLERILVLRKAQSPCANRIGKIDARMNGKGNQIFSFKRFDWVEATWGGWVKFKISPRIGRLTEIVQFRSGRTTITILQCRNDMSIQNGEKWEAAHDEPHRNELF